MMLKHIAKILPRHPHGGEYGKEWGAVGGQLAEILPIHPHGGEYGKEWGAVGGVCLFIQAVAHILSLFGNYNLLIISLIGAKEMIYNIDKQ